MIRVGKLLFRVTNVKCIRSWNPKDETGALVIREGFTIRFNEPTAFRSEGITRLFPEPRLVFGSLSNKWLQATGEKVPTEVLLEMEAKILPIRYTLYTCALQMDRFFVTGFVGQCVYRMDSGIPAECLEHLGCLLRIIPFTGIGYKTAMGMGVSDCVRTREASEEYGRHDII